MFLRYFSNIQAGSIRQTPRGTLAHGRLMTNSTLQVLQKHSCRVVCVDIHAAGGATFYGGNGRNSGTAACPAKTTTNDKDVVNCQHNNRDLEIQVSPLIFKSHLYSTKWPPPANAGQQQKIRNSENTQYCSVESLAVPAVLISWSVNEQ